MGIPLYASDNSLLDFIGEKRALRLEGIGLAKVVRHKGVGSQNRVIRKAQRYVTMNCGGGPHLSGRKPYRGRVPEPS